VVSLATGLLLGLLLGMRHALEPDHLAAVSVLVTRRRSNPAAGAILGAIWGVGHTLALLAVACVLATLGSRLPVRVAGGLEIVVAVMLVTLGARAVVRVRRQGRPSPEDMSGSSRSRWRLARQPFVVGLIHGLAGSGSLTALVLASLPTAATRFCYLALFGIGSVIGMAFLTGLAGWPLARLKANDAISRWLSIATGVFSLLLGSFWGWSAVRALIRT
jgi:hypothetical protein